MTTTLLQHHRRSIRLKGYDYSQLGSYFITIVTQNRAILFGKIIDDEMVLNDAGKMIKKWYREIENKFSDIKCDEFICMPNHVHFILMNVGYEFPISAFVGADLCVCPCEGEHTGSPLRKSGECNQGEWNQGEHVGSPLRKSGEWNQGEHTGSPLHESGEWNQGEHVGSPLRESGEWNQGEHTGSPLQRIIQWFKTMTTNDYIKNVKKNNWIPFDKKFWQRNYYEHIIRNEKDLNKIREYSICNPANWKTDENYCSL